MTTQAQSRNATSPLPSGQQADAVEREWWQTTKADGRLCVGWPADHFCPVVIPMDKPEPICYGCQRTRDIEFRTIRGDVIHSAADVLAEMDIKFYTACLDCGGDANGQYHAQSLTHLRSKKGLYNPRNAV